MKPGTRESKIRWDPVEEDGDVGEAAIFSTEKNSKLGIEKIVNRSHVNIHSVSKTLFPFSSRLLHFYKPMYDPHMTNVDDTYTRDSSPLSHNIYIELSTGV